MKLTNRTLSNLLPGLPLSKIRRWTKEFLPPDPRATRRSGYTRELTPNESYYVILGGYFVDTFGWTYHQTRKVLDIIWPWLEKNGMVPEIPEWAKREGVDAYINKYESMTLYADSHNNITGIEIRGFESQEEIMETGKDKLNREYVKRKSESFIYWLIGDLDTIIKTGSKNIGQIYINGFLGRHLFSIFEPSQYKNWQKQFREIAERDLNKQ